MRPNVLYHRPRVCGLWLGTSSAVTIALCWAGPVQGQAAMAQPPDLLPTGPAIAAGDISIASMGPGGLAITQTSARAIVNWDSFSIGRDASVAFHQPNAAAAILNRVTGSTPTTIAGRLTGNGQIYLVNPNGITAYSKCP